MQVHLYTAYIKCAWFVHAHTDVRDAFRTHTCAHTQFFSVRATISRYRTFGSPFTYTRALRCCTRALCHLLPLYTHAFCSGRGRFGTLARCTRTRTLATGWFTFTSGYVPTRTCGHCLLVTHGLRWCLVRNFFTGSVASSSHFASCRTTTHPLVGLDTFFTTFCSGSYHTALRGLPTPPRIPNFVFLVVLIPTIPFAIAAFRGATRWARRGTGLVTTLTYTVYCWTFPTPHTLILHALFLHGLPPHGPTHTTRLCLPLCISFTCLGPSLVLPWIPRTCTPMVYDLIVPTGSCAFPLWVYIYFTRHWSRTFYDLVSCWVLSILGSTWSLYSSPAFGCPSSLP